MQRFKILYTFIPWLIFAGLYGNSKHQIIYASIIALFSVIVLNRNELRKGFIFPWLSIIYFTFITINGLFHLWPWIEYHSVAMINWILAAIVWISLIIKRPFTLQYAQEQTPMSYWKSPLFIKINYYLSFAWAILLTISAMPNLFIPEGIYIKSWFWNYGFSTLCLLFAFYLNKKLPNILIGQNFWNKVKNLPPVDSLYLKDGYAPIHEEVIIKDLIIEGEIPNDLNGIYLRNGANPYYPPYTYSYPIDGDGMIHKLTFRNGCVSYQNRFVMTKGLTAEIKAGKALYAGIELSVPADPRLVGSETYKNNASIHVIKWQDKYLALYEKNIAYILDKDLNTLGEWQPTGATSPFIVNAHHRIDPKNGHTFMFCYDVLWEHSYLKIYEFNKQKELIKTILVDKPRATMLHDLVITKNYIVLFDVPAIFNVAGNDGSEPFFAYKENLPVSIIIINRSNYKIQTIDNIPSFFVYHFVNAFEEDDKILLDFIYHNKLEFNPAAKSDYEAPSLYRAIINLTDMSYSHKQVLDLALEFPVYNLAYTGDKYQYCYLISKVKGHNKFNQLIKYDNINNSVQVIDFGGNFEIDEPIFIAKDNPLSEDDGYIGIYVYNQGTNKSDFLIYEAKNFTQQLAKVVLPIRVPHGLHGSWVNEEINI